MARGLFRHPPQPTQRGKFVQPPPPVVVCYHDTVIADTPINYWRLGEPSGTNAVDEIGANAGTYTGGPTLGAASLLSGDTNTAITITASTQYVSVSGLNIPTSAFTLEAWSKGAYAGADSGLIGQWSGAAGSLLYLNGNPNEVGMFVNATEITATKADLTDGNPHHFAGTFDGTNMRLYYDGALIAGPTAATMTLAAVTFEIGSYNNHGSANSFDGSIDEPALYNYALSATQVAAHYAARSVSCGGGSVAGALAFAVTSSDAWTRSGTFLRAQAESVTSSDVWTRSGTFLRALSSGVTSADVWTRAGTFLRAWAGAVTQTDAWSGVKVFLRAMSESVQSSDVWTRSGTFLRSTSESVQSADAWSRTLTALRALAGAVTSADVWTRSGTFLRALSESVTSSDAWTGVKVFLRGWAESVTSSDAWSRSGTFLRTWTGAVTSSDAWTRSGTFLRGLAESVQSFDTWIGQKTGAVIASFTSAVTSSDAWTRSGTFSRTLAESVTSAMSMVGSLASLVIGGIPPTIASAVSSVVQAIANALRPGGGASGPKPDGDASNPKPGR